jgi:hexosaminidase
MKPLCLLFSGLLVAFAQGPPDSLMPLPASISVSDGRLAIDGTFSVSIAGHDEPRLRAAALRLIERLSRRTGIPLRPEISASAKAALVLRCEGPSQPVQAVGENESHVLEVSSTGALLRAPTPLGLLRGMETFLQLVRLDAQGFAVPAVTIRDAPRFPWRGLLIDIARHFMPMPVLKRNIDAMAAVKLNVLHLHITDDQGFRIESKVFPRLHQLGSDGEFYTQDQMREIIAYARGRGIRVVPEFEMPGHASSWFPGYPELASAPGPHKIERTWGVHYGLIDPTREEVYQFLDRLIGEMAGLFPDSYFHIGGDEVRPRPWDESAAIQAFMKKNGIRDAAALQAYFNRRLLAILTKHGKRMIGWDEILHPDLPKDIVVHSWRGPKSLAAAARQGYQGILSNGYYLDLMRPAASHYAIDPLSGDAATLTAEETKRILGGEACIWSEYVSPEILDARIWPRMAAIAERFWSPAAAASDVESMYRRMEAVSPHLELAGSTHRAIYRTMLERLADGSDTGALETLAEVVEPLKEYARAEARSYYSDTPLNRLVDTVPAESLAARAFNRRVERMEAADIPGIRDALVRWRDNHVRLLPLIRRSALLAEVEPVSESLAKMAALGLEALDYRQQGKRPPAEWVKSNLALLDTLTLRPAAELLIQIKPGIQTLVRAIE